MAKETTSTKAKAKDTENDTKENQSGAGTADDPVRVAVVQAPVGDLGVGTAGPALTERQRAGLDPVDPEHDAEQAAHRDDLPNMQTDHEAENALDPLSGTPNTAITEAAPLTGVGAGQKPTDMSGRPALALDEDARDEGISKARKKGQNPELSEADKSYVNALKGKLTDAKKADEDDDGINDQDKGWRTPLQLGIPGGVMARLHQSGKYPIEEQEMAGATFFPETGRRYRSK